MTEHRMRKSLLRVVASLALVTSPLATLPSALAVMAGDPAGNPPDSPRQRVDANVKLSVFGGVGALVVSGGVYTGTLVGPRHVLTAAHVVNGAKPESVTFVLNWGHDASQRITAATIHVHPEFGEKAGPGRIPEHDLAVVELTAPAEPGVPIYRMVRGPLAVGVPIAIVGYGGSGDAVKGVYVNGSETVKRAGANRIDRFVFARAEPTRRIGYLFDFDGPTLATNVIGEAIPANGTMGNRVETTLATGDSGSPVFVRDPRGRPLLAGVSTFVVQTGGRAMGAFGTLAGGMLVSAYLPWIESIVTGVGGEGGDAASAARPSEGAGTTSAP